MKNFGITGLGGYIAPRHLKAIKDTGNNLIAALDPKDSVGIIDSYFPKANFFTEPERFERHLEQLRFEDNPNKIDYLSICSPNHLHDSHIRLALRSNADAICEKPIVLNPYNIDYLKQVENLTGRKVYTILQLRLHPTILDLKERIDSGPQSKVYDFDLTYITSRGNWYQYSWKGDEDKSGGIATNIGVHFFDVLHFLFGNVKTNIVHHRTKDVAAGYLEYDKARVRWFLSINSSFLPDSSITKGMSTYRAMFLDNKEIEFSTGFTELHNRVYEQILNGKGFELEENRSAIETVYSIRNASIENKTEDYHPFLKQMK